MSDGLIYAFTGDGKGKTSAALGVATRSLLNGENVVWVAFYKQESWGLSESKLVNKFPSLKMYFSGKGFKIGKKIAPVGNKGHIVVDTASNDEHVKAAKIGLEQGKSSLLEKPFLLVMDEILNAVSDGMLTSEEVIEFMKSRGETHIVLTGRAGTEPARTVLAGSDLVTECKKIKHPYDLGKLAVKGLDF